MTTSIDELYDRAMALPSDVEEKFLKLGDRYGSCWTETHPCFTKS